MLPTATTDLYEANQQRVAALLALLYAQWRLMGDDFEAGWRRVGPRMTALTSAAMVGAARDGAAMVPAALRQQGMPVPAPLATIDPHRFGRTASDGRALAPLLYTSVVAARSADVSSLTERLAVGQQQLTKIAHTQVVDAARQSAGATITAHPRTGFRRYVNPPCCQNCAVLAGRVYMHNAGFERHPNCDCVHLPTSLDGHVTGGDFSEEIPDLSQITDLTIAQRKAIEDGADLGRVVTKRRDAYRNRMRTPGEQPGSRYKPRIGSVDWIYGRERTREQTVSLLTRYGYLRSPVSASRLSA